jgi:hypothetical protein
MFRDAAPVAVRLPNAAKGLALQPQLNGRPRLGAGGPLSQHPPQLPGLPFASHQSSTTLEERVEQSSTSLTQVDIEYAAVPEPPTNSDRSHRPSPFRKFSLPFYHPMQPRKIARYYASALTHDEKTALAEGQKNHNLKSWTAKDLILHEEALKDNKPTNLFISPDEQVCIIPMIIVTDDRRHVLTSSSCIISSTSCVSVAHQRFNKRLADRSLKNVRRSLQPAVGLATVVTSLLNTDLCRTDHLIQLRLEYEYVALSQTKSATISPEKTSPLMASWCRTVQVRVRRIASKRTYVRRRRQSKPWVFTHGIVDKIIW